MPFSYDYTVQFRDTDAAGVVYFASILSICHVAYEASLVAAGIELKSFVINPEFAVPIAHVAADFLQPLYCGDRIKIELTPTRTDDYKFEIVYRILSAERAAATVTTGHVTIDPQLRKRRELPAAIVNWLTQYS
jgi:1,4-dihydroxy-2-naphthoyl-CoA hydrolase